MILSQEKTIKFWILIILLTIFITSKLQRKSMDLMCSIKPVWPRILEESRNVSKVAMEEVDPTIPSTMITTTEDPEVTTKKLKIQDKIRHDMMAINRKLIHHDHNFNGRDEDERKPVGYEETDQLSELAYMKKYNLKYGDLEDFGEISLPDAVSRVGRSVEDHERDQHNRIEKRYICCYQDPNDSNNIGRPILLNQYSRKHWGKYMKAKPISREEKLSLTPTPVTGCSTNHFHEHLSHVEQVKKYFPGKKIVFYDLGLNLGEVLYLKNKTDTYIYRKLNFRDHPWHVSMLKTYAWKIAIWGEVLPEFGSIIWFDTSIWFWQGAEDLIESKIRYQDSSFVYYIKEAAHDISSHTHPLMYSYFPSNLTQHTKLSTHMKMAGASVLYNDRNLQQNIMKWGLLCALTPDCIFPERSMKTCTPPSAQLYHQEKYRKHQYLTNYNEINEETGEIDPDLTYSAWKKTSDRVRYCHRFDQAMMSILVENFYNYEIGKFFCHHGTSIAKPLRSGVNLKFDYKNLGSADAHDKIRELNEFTRISIEMRKNGSVLWHSNSDL